MDVRRRRPGVASAVRVPRLCALLALVATAACALWQPQSAKWFSVMHSSGGPAPFVRGATFFEDGRVELWAGDRTRGTRRLSSQDVQRLGELLRSPEWSAGLAWVSAQGEDWSCCDRATISIALPASGEFFAIPVTALGREAGGAELADPGELDSPGLRELAPGLQVLDRMLLAHFGARWRGFGEALR